MRNSEPAGFLGIICKVTLGIKISIVTDYFNGIFICSDSTVGTKSPEFASYRSFRSSFNLFFNLQRCMSNIIIYAYGKSVFGTIHFQIIIYSFYLARSGVLGTKSISSAHNKRSAFQFEECIFNIQIERFTGCTGFFRPVKNCNFFNRIRYGLEEKFIGKRPIEMNLDNSYLFAQFIQVMDRFIDCIRNGSHSNDYMFCILCPHIIKWLIFPAG